MYFLTATPVRNNLFEFFILIKQFYIGKKIQYKEIQWVVKNINEKKQFYEYFLKDGEIANENVFYELLKNKVSFFKHPKTYLFPNINFSIKFLDLTKI